MKPMHLDTLSYANRLKAAGMASALAEEQAMVIKLGGLMVLSLGLLTTLVKLI
jgi:hypothetical protein